MSRRPKRKARPDDHVVAKLAARVTARKHAEEALPEWAQAELKRLRDRNATLGVRVQDLENTLGRAYGRINRLEASLDI